MADAGSNSAAASRLAAGEATGSASTAAAALESTSSSANTSLNASMNSSTANGANATASGSLPSDSTDPNPKAPLQGAELKAALAAQIDLIFSREYLSGDYSIVSQMNSELWMPLTSAFELPHLKSLTTDVAAIQEALQGSAKVVVDLANKQVRPNFKLQRNTIILRDIPSEKTDADVRALFDDEKISSQISDVKKDIDCWFVTFTSEDITTDAFLHVRQKKINDQPVQARVKSENLLKSTFANTSYFNANAYAYQQQFAATAAAYSQWNQNRPAQGQYYQNQGRSYERSYDKKSHPRGGAGGNFSNGSQGRRGGQQSQYSTRRGGAHQPRYTNATNGTVAAATNGSTAAPAGTQATALQTTTQTQQPQQPQHQSRAGQPSGRRNGNPTTNTNGRAANPRPRHAQPGATQGTAAVPTHGTPKITSADFPPLSRGAASDVKRYGKEELVGLFAGALNPAPAAGTAGDDFSAFSAESSSPAKPEFVHADANVVLSSPQEPEAMKPLPAGASIRSELLETGSTLSKRRSSSSAGRDRSSSNPRQRPAEPHPVQQQPTAAQIAAASADKRPPLPPTAASVVASSAKKPSQPQQQKAAAKPPVAPKEAAPAKAEKASPKETPAEKTAPKPVASTQSSAGPSWASLAAKSASAAAAAPAPEKKAAKPAKAAAPAAPAQAAPAAAPVAAAPAPATTAAAPASN